MILALAPDCITSERGSLGYSGYSLDTTLIRAFMLDLSRTGLLLD